MCVEGGGVWAFGFGPLGLEGSQILLEFNQFPTYYTEWPFLNDL